MKLFTRSRHGVGALLCVLPILSTLGVACAADETAAPVAETQVAATQVAATNIILRDVNQMRTIEVQSDREESVDEFFARQRLSLVQRPNVDGKYLSVGETIKGEPLKFFASYPLDNDHDFAPHLYGAYYEMAPTSPTVAALFGNSITPLDWSNTLLIVAPLSGQKETELNKSACIVGRIWIKNPDKWRPDLDIESLKYRGTEEKAGTDKI